MIFMIVCLPFLFSLTFSIFHQSFNLTADYVHLTDDYVHYLFIDGSAYSLIILCLI